jgi:hypothetical protein
MIAGADTSLEFFLPLQNTSADNSGKGLTVTPVGTPTYADSPFGRAISLNGTSQFLGIGHASALVSGNFTVCAWAYQASENGVQAAGIIDKVQTLDATISCWSLLVRPNRTNYRFSFSADGSTMENVDSAATPPLTTWTFVAATKNGTAIRLMVNGLNDATGTASSATIHAGTNSVGIGARNADKGGTVFWPGRIARPMYFSRALSDNELRSVMAGFSPWGS